MLHKIWVWFLDRIAERVLFMMDERLKVASLVPDKDPLKEWAPHPTLENHALVKYDRGNGVTSSHCIELLPHLRPHEVLEYLKNHYSANKS